MKSSGFSRRRQDGIKVEGVELRVQSTIVISARSGSAVGRGFVAAIVFPGSSVTASVLEFELPNNRP